MAKSGAAIVVLERLARSAGATRWYVADDTDQLQDVVNRLRPGSFFSFYRDGRVKRAPFDDEIEIELMQDIERAGGAVLGWRIPGIPELAMQIVSGLMDLSELAAEATAQREVFYGAYPGRDCDGVNAITLVLPDADGVRRNHPHWPATLTKFEEPASADASALALCVPAWSGRPGLESFCSVLVQTSPHTGCRGIRE